MLLLVGAALAVWAIMRAEGYTTQAFTTRQQFIKAAKQRSEEHTSELQ